MKLTKSGTHIYGKATLTRFEEILKSIKTEKGVSEAHRHSFFCF
ncbi:Uncharacterised protein [Streptococcus pneumoniae]|nr:Uncharacterised protein [Streptococcus pneumoniae]